MPAAPAQRVPRALPGQDLERRELEIADGADRPAVAAVGRDELRRRLLALPGALQQASHVDAAGGGRGQDRALGVQRRGGCGTDRRVLAAEQFPGLRRPGQQLAVEGEPVGPELVPQPCRPDRAGDAAEQFPLNVAVGEERPPGPGVDHSGTRDAEPAAGDAPARPPHHHRPPAPLLFLPDPVRPPPPPPPPPPPSPGTPPSPPPPPR